MKRLSLTAPHLLVMIGTPGAGKSFFARQFADTFTAPLISYNTLRSVVSNGQPTNDKTEQAIVQQIATEQLDQLLLTGSTVIIDGGPDARNERQVLVKKARSHGYKTLFIWVQTDPIAAKRRAIIGVRGQSNAADLLSQEQYDTALKRFTPPNDAEPFIVISGKHTYATQARIVLKKLSEPRTNHAAEQRLASNEQRPTNSDRPLTGPDRTVNRIRIS